MKIFLFVFITSLSLIAFFIESSYGRIYYVKPNGNDALSGLDTTNAWRTLHRVDTTTFNAGDTIKLRGGSIFEPDSIEYVQDAALWINRSGKQDSFMVFTSYPTSQGIRATIKVNVNNGRGIFCANRQYVKICNINVRGFFNPFN